MRVWATGPAEVECERAGPCEHSALLKIAGTYALNAALDGSMLPGARVGWTPATMFGIHLAVSHAPHRASSQVCLVMYASYASEKQLSMSSACPALRGLIQQGSTACMQAGPSA